jgi:error-prone DNA polymerase
MSTIHPFPEPQEVRRIETPDAPIPTYAELAVTTNFSFLRGGSHPEELVTRARELGLAGIGIADRNSVAGVVRAHTAARPQDEGEPQRPFRIAVGTRLVFADNTPDILAYPQDRAAWGRLTRLLTVGKSRAEKGDCILFLDDLIEHGTGLNLVGNAASMPAASRRCSEGYVCACRKLRHLSPKGRGRIAQAIRVRGARHEPSF